MSKILIVDDKEKIRYLLQIMLSTNGYEVQTAANGAEALEQASRAAPDLIISDILMPVMDGFSLCRAWKADPQFCQIPFIFYTATYTDPRDEEFALSLGADRFIVKPTDTKPFLASIRQVLETFQQGKLVANQVTAPDEQGYYKEYNQSLVRKLEDKVLELKRANRRLAALYEASHTFVGRHPVGELILVALESIVETAGYQEAEYFAYDEASQKFQIQDLVGAAIPPKIRELLTFKIGEERGLVGLVGQTRQSLIVPDVTQDPRWVMQEDNKVRSVLFVPVVHGERLLGVATLASNQVDDFKEEDARNITTLTNNLAIAIENNRLFDQVQRSELYYRTILENSADAILSVNSQSQITVWNTGAERIFGYSKAEILGQQLEILVPPSAQSLTARKYQEMQEFGSVTNFETQRLSKDGQLIDVEITLTSLGPELGSTAILRDIRERKRIEEEIRQLNAGLEKRVEERTQELRQAQEQVLRQEKLALLGKLASSVGHELRNPLGVINSAVYYLKLVQPDATAKIKQYHLMIEGEVKRAEQIITDLLDFARIKSVDSAPVLLPALLQRVLGRFPIPDLVKTGLNLPADLPKIYVDPIHLERVLGNLIENACQAMPEGGELTLSAERRKEKLAIVVQDTGVGITPENMKKLFEPLFSTKARGVGLGLAVSRKLMEANHGSIEAFSEPGKGSYFTILLPVHNG